MAREMKNSGVQWIGDIPSNWGMSKFKAEGSVLSGFPFNSEKFTSDTGFPLIRIRDITSGQAGTFYDGDYPTSYIIHDGDFLLGMDGEFNVRWWQGGDALLNQRCCRLSLNNKFFAKYIFYLIPFGLKLINDLAYSTTVKHLSVPDILNLSLLVPPLSEQKVIADFLDAKCGEIDGLLSDLETEVKTLTEYKKSIIAETVTRGLNPNAPMKSSGIPWAEIIPAHWEIDKGKFRFELRRTKGNPRNLELMSPTQKYGVIPQSQLEGVVLVKENTDLNAFRTICIGDFCISLRSFQGGFEYSNYEGVVSPAYQVFYPIKPIADGYYKYIFKSEGFISYINTFSMSLRDGKNIAFEDFGNSFIPVPPMEEQIEIANYLDSKCAAIDQAITDKTQQIETLKAYKSSLIYEYVTGKKQVL